jgi:hypothetical protein
VRPRQRSPFWCRYSGCRLTGCNATDSGATQHNNLIDNNQKISFVNQTGAVLQKASYQRESQLTLSVYFSYIKITGLLVNPNSFLF